MSTIQTAALIVDKWVLALDLFRVQLV